MELKVPVAHLKFHIVHDLLGVDLVLLDRLHQLLSPPFLSLDSLLEVEVLLNELLVLLLDDQHLVLAGQGAALVQIVQK